MVEAVDRVGILRDLADVISRNKGNVLFNISHTKDHEYFALFIVDYPGDVGRLREELLKVEGVGRVKLGSGPRSTRVYASYMAIDAAVAKSLTSFLKPNEFLEVLARVDQETRSTVYTMLPPDYLAKLLHAAPPEIVSEATEALPPERVAKALLNLYPSEVADLLQLMPETVHKKVIPYLPKDVLDTIKYLMKYPPDTAGGLMAVSVPVASESTTVNDALSLIKSGAFKVKDVIFVVDAEGKLRGCASLPDLLREPPSSQLKEIMRRDVVSVSPFTDREEVAKLMIKRDVPRVSVVDKDGKFLGVVLIDDVLDVLTEEHTEDLLLSSGISPGVKFRFLTTKTRSMFWSRFSWLLFIYLIESVTVTIIKGYEDLIAKIAILAAFIPLMVDTGGNTGSQSSTMITRALALGEITPRDLLRVVGKELPMCFLLAAAMGFAGFLFAFLMSSSLHVSLVVALALFLVITVSDMIGSLLPLAAYKLRVDPAAMSGPLITTIADIIGVALYLAVAYVVLMY